MAWIDYRKTYNIVRGSWIIECIKLAVIADNVINVLQKSMDQRKISLTASGEDLVDAKVKMGIFQAENLSPLLLVLSINPLSLILRKVNSSCDWGGKEYKLIICYLWMI